MKLQGDTKMEKIHLKDTARIIITFKCNLHCDYCSSYKALKEEKYEIINSINDIIKLHDKFVITGGEPMININRLLRIACVIPRLTFKYLSTNGTLIKPFEFFTLNNLFNGINIGIHSETQFNLINPVVFTSEKVKLKIRKDIFDKILKNNPFLYGASCYIDTWHVKKNCDVPSNEILYVLKEALNHETRY